MMIKTTLSDAAIRLNSDEAKLEAQLLLQHALNVNRAWLIAHENDSLIPAQTAAFEALLIRRLKGEPIAYILGCREFFGLKLMVSPDTLIPRPDTETLVEAALDKLRVFGNVFPTLPSAGRGELNSPLPRWEGGRGEGAAQHSPSPQPSPTQGGGSLGVLDLGTGSGAIALAIAKAYPQASVIAVDASQAALGVAKQNAQNLNIHNVQFLLSNWFAGLENTKFDIIVSNPPYIEDKDPHLNQGDLRFEPLSALSSGTDGLDDIRKIVNDSLIYLKPQGWLMLEHGYNQAQQVADLMADIGLTNIETLQDLGGNDRVTIGKNPLIVSAHWG